MDFAVAPELTSPEPRTVIAQKGEHVEMTCKVREYVFPVANVTWFKEVEKSVLEVETGSVFSIASVNLDDSGLYYCQAVNDPEKQVATKLFHLTVYGTMIITY